MIVKRRASKGEEVAAVLLFRGRRETRRQAKRVDQNNSRQPLSHSAGQLGTLFAAKELFAKLSLGGARLHTHSKRSR